MFQNNQFNPQYNILEIPFLPINQPSYLTNISPMAINPSNSIYYNVNNPFNYPFNNPMFKTHNSYPNINNDPKLRKNMVNYYWNKINNWLNNSSLYKKILNNLIFINNKIEIGLDDKNNDMKTQLLKIEYILIHIINKKDLYNILDNFCKFNQINYWDLQEIDVKNKAKKFIYKKIKYTMFK